MTGLILCNLVKTRAGWSLTFPGSPQAGLLLDKVEVEEFLNDCGVFNINPSNPMFFFATANCPTHWYTRACTFKPCPF